MTTLIRRHAHPSGIVAAGLALVAAAAAVSGVGAVIASLAVFLAGALTIAIGRTLVDRLPDPRR